MYYSSLKMYCQVRYKLQQFKSAGKYFTIPLQHSVKLLLYFTVLFKKVKFIRNLVWYDRDNFIQ